MCSARNGGATTKGDTGPHPWLGFFLESQMETEVSRAMPTYEYRCPEGHRFELVQKMSEEPRAKCPECGAESERLLSAGAGFLFKGGGFYTTDYRSDSYKKDASKEESAGVSKKATAEKPKQGKGKGKGKEKGKERGKDSGSSSPEGS